MTKDYFLAAKFGSIAIISSLVITFSSMAQNMDIRGKLRVVDGTQGAGKVLTSDANGLASWTAPSSTPPVTYTVGMQAQGGTVFYVSPSGQHGLVVANKDQSNLTNWYGATQAANRPQLHDDAGKEYFDWRLPSNWELQLVNELYYNGTLPASLNFSNAFYWSSLADITITYNPDGTVTIWDYGYGVEFPSGQLLFKPKRTSPLEQELRTRAVRSF